jgi:hypothetical protein
VTFPARCSTRLRGVTARFKEWKAVARWALFILSVFFFWGGGVGGGPTVGIACRLLHGFSVEACKSISACASTLFVAEGVMDLEPLLLINRRASNPYAYRLGQSFHDM